MRQIRCSFSLHFSISNYVQQLLTESCTCCCGKSCPTLITAPIQTELCFKIIIRAVIIINLSAVAGELIRVKCFFLSLDRSQELQCAWLLVAFGKYHTCPCAPFEAFLHHFPSEPSGHRVLTHRGTPHITGFSRVVAL